MALNIPMPQLPGTALMNGLNTGGQLFSRIIQAKNAQKANQLHPSGDVANSAYISQLENQYGPNHPAVLEAKRAHELALNGHQSLIDTRDVLNQTAGIRYASPLGKLIMEGKGEGAKDILDRRNNNKNNQQNNIQPNSPAGARYQVGEQYYNQQGDPVYSNNSSGNNPRTDEEKNAYQGAISKQTTDAATREKIPYIENAGTTFKNLNMDDLVTYSGLKGSSQYGKDFIKAGLGKPSDRFINFNKAVTTANLLSKQLRQVWKDSVQPSAQDEIKKLTNPSTWYKDPKVAKAQLEQFKQITDKELETFKKAGTSPINLHKLDFKDGKFVIEGSDNTQVNNKLSKEEDDLLKKWGSQLTDINPQWTSANIKHTAQLRNKSVGQIIDELMAKGK